MTLPTDLSFMDLLLDKEDNLLNFDKDLIGDEMKFSLDHKNINVSEKVIALCLIKFQYGVEY